jgi:hypothetical protein
MLDDEQQYLIIQMFGDIKLIIELYEEQERPVQQWKNFLECCRKRMCRYIRRQRIQKVNEILQIMKETLTQAAKAEGF